MSFNRDGFTLVEMLVAMSFVGILAAITAPIASSYYSECSMKVTITKIASMIREARALALTSGENTGVCFNTTNCDVTLALNHGADVKWNTSDDVKSESFRLASSVRFGFGACGPIPGLAAEADGVSFQSNNSLICNPDLSSNAGTVYLTSSSKSAMAVTVSSNNEGYKIWICRSGIWSH